MSSQRFIRCPHCGLPHEAELTVCPVQGKALSAPKPRRRPAPPPSEEDYSWAHSLAPWSRGEGERDLDPSSLHTFIGKIVEGKYRIEALIGRGGMGAVFRARNTRIDKAVALKVLYRGYDKGSESERRFLREARIAGNLGHPNIVEVFDLGHLDEGMPFQVMELLEGQSLAQRVHHEGPLTESDALDIADQVLGALEAAHERGIIHRDLKPENVFLTERRGETTAKLLDFGVSKSLTEQTMSMTMTGVVVGTPYYLSPEQARGDREYDHRIDIWAMGVLLYESLTGVLPFNADSYEKLLVKILKQRPVAPSRFQPRISPSVEEVILRALSPDAADRPASAQIMLEDLRDARRAARDAFRAFGSDTMSDPPRFPSADATIKTRAVSVSAMPGPEDPTEVSDSFVSDDLRVVLERGKKEP